VRCGMEHIKVLVIEDNPAYVRVLCETLTKQRAAAAVKGRSFDVEYAMHLAAGLQRLAAGGIDVVLLDLMLPDSQGLDTLTRLSQQAPDIPVVVLTAFDVDDFEIQALHKGAQDYLIKGQVDGRMLVHALRSAIERQQMRRALQASEARLQNLIIHNADGVLVVDRGGVIRFVNPAAEALFGCTAAELLGTVFGSPVMAGEITELDIARKHGAPAVAEMRVVEAEWEGEVAFLASLRDITERRQAEERLRQRDEQLRQAHKMEAIGRLAGGVAHDFNNLLTAIIGYSDIMLMRLAADDVLYRYVEQISKAANRAALLTRQLLTFSRRQVFQKRLINLNTVVPEMEKMLQPLIGEDIQLITRLSPQLGWVDADLGHMQQLVMNLVVNARDAMPQGGLLLIETANVTLEDTPRGRYLQAPAGPYVMLSVQDSGAGMDSEIMSHLFEPFFTTKDPGKGTGLGLAVVYGILEQEGGDIEVQSVLGEGTTFKIYLPRVEGSLPEAGTGEVSAALPSGLETVLVVEDEPIVRLSIRDTLQLNGYCVLEAKDTQEALHFCTHHAEPIHLLITDVVMPGMSGRALADRITALHKDMRVLFISGHPGDAIARHGVVYPNAAFLPKPFTPDALARKVREILDKPAPIC
jgi:signal transduction histidine kinase/DNA-binding response OmpR family regulator